MAMHQFDRDIAFKPGEPFSFSGQISDNWSVNGVPDGGYLMAILANAMMVFCASKKVTCVLASGRSEKSRVK